MGGMCSGGTNHRNLNNGGRPRGLSGRLRSMRSFNNKQKQISNQYLDSNPKESRKKERENSRRERPMHNSCELKRLAPIKTLSTKVPQKTSLLGRAGLEMAVEVLDTLGSSVSSLNTSSGFVSGVASRGNKMSILAFEVANTVTKGASLLLSLSEENIKSFKKEVLRSKGVMELVSTDMKELLSIAAADKRGELQVFSKEVIRFGNLCKDPQWRNLNRYFKNLELDPSHYKQPRDEVETKMQELVTLAQHTSELYHELQVLDSFEQDYRRKFEELKALNLPRKGESFTVLQSELKQQKRLVRNLQKKSFWSRSLEEVMEKLVDIVAYMQQAITDAFGDSGSSATQKTGAKHGRLGEAGLALHYANIVQQIDSIASGPSFLPPNTRDALYHALPQSIKTALCSHLRSPRINKELSISDIKAELERTLHWLAPLATNTTKAHQGFGWVGEWANTGMELSGSTAENTSLTRLQTLYHGDKQKMDMLILKLVVWLHHLITKARQRDHGHRDARLESSPDKRPEFHSTTQLSLSPDYSMYKTSRTQLSLEDRFLLERVSKRRIAPRVSKSQEFVRRRKIGAKIWFFNRSTGRSPSRGLRAKGVPEQPRADILDILDGLDFAL